MFYSIGRAIASLDSRNLLEEFEGVADRIQRSLLDIAVPAVRGIEIGVRAAPARIVGGDYIDIIQRPDSPPLFAIGDASGKSLPAALRAIAVKYVIRGLALVLGNDVASIVSRANDVICSDIEPDTFVTFIIVTLTDDNQTLICANAGHDPPLLYRAATRHIEEMAVGGLASGVDPRYRYVEQRAALKHGDIVVLFTDGFTEARSPAGELFTVAQLKEGLSAFHDLPAQQLADALFERIEQHTAGTLNDDATILIIRVLE